MLTGYRAAQMRGNRDRTVIFLGSLNPTGDCILDILHRFEFGGAVRYAAGKVRHGRNEAAAVFLRQRLNDDLIVRTLAHVVSVSQEGYQLPDIYWFNRPFERHCQDFNLSGLGNLVVRAATARRDALGAVKGANRLHILDAPSRRLRSISSKSYGPPHTSDLERSEAGLTALPRTRIIVELCWGGKADA